MSFTSLYFPVFCIISVIIYYKIPKRYQWISLLVLSVIFYACSDLRYLLFLGLSIVTTWALMIKPTKFRTVMVFVINLTLLAACKYCGIFAIKNIMLPLGISFYTFMTLGYALDVYGEIIQPQQNLAKYALFISYFPQITQGPIGNYGTLEPQLFSGHDFDGIRFRNGAYRIIKGYFKKLVIAGRLADYVSTVYRTPGNYGGLTLVIATVFYAVQLYCDFSGYMDIALGISEMFGIKLDENFDKPYFSKSIPEYWRRWHVTLNDWFRDHLFYPLMVAEWNRRLSDGLKKIMPGVKTATIRTMFALAAVWVTTGIWHGASWTYVCWGVYYALIMMLSTGTRSWMKKFCRKIHWNAENELIRIFCTVRTFFIVCIGYVLFRAASAADALTVYRTVFTGFRINAPEIAAALVPFGNGNQAAASVLIIGVFIIGLFAYELSEIKGSDVISRHKYILSGVMIVSIILFGVFGQSNFLYQAF